MVFSNNLLMGAAGQGGGYEIDQSIRFNRDDTAKLTKTFGTATNRKIFTFSVWVKNGKSAGSIIEYNATGGVTWANINFGGNRIDYFDYSGGSARIDLRSTAVFRDPSAWYHLVVAMDTTQGTASNRLKFYINGTQITAFGTSTYPSLNFEGFINSSVSHLIGKGVNGPFDGYLAEYHFVDGQALAPTDFGEYNDNGVWIPIEASPTYGNNGFYLTGATASDLGEDFSGNNNDFTSTGLATTDQMLDTPTLNYCTLNPNDKFGSGLTLSDGNLRAVPSASAYCNNHGTFYVNSGKWVFEVKHTTVFGEACGWSPMGERISGSSNRGYFMFADGRAYINVSNQGTKGASLSSGDYRYIFYDADLGAMWFAHVDVSSSNALVYDNSATKAEIEAGTTTNAVFTSIQDVDFAPGLWMDTSGVMEVNFGQSAFITTSDLPTGFNTLNTANLATPSIKDGSAYFQPTLYTGDSSTDNTITGVGFEPDFVWLKARTLGAGGNHVLVDSVRGDGNSPSATKELYSSLTNAESSTNIIGFNSDGFRLLSTGSGDQRFNQSGQSYVAWCWKANGTGSSNEDGSINTTATSANTTAGFSISTYTGTGSNATVGHGLGIAPSFVLIKSRNDTHDWYVWTPALATTEFLQLNSSAAKGTASPEVWNSTAPTSSVVSLGTSIGVNRNTYNYVMYCFAEIPGYSSIGSYEGNGSTDGTFVYTGFRPSLLLVKNIDAADSWQIRDSKRDPFNVSKEILYPNTSGAEATSGGGQFADLLSNGFKWRGADPGNNSAATFTYMAFAENPFNGDGVAPATAR